MAGDKNHNDREAAAAKKRRAAFLRVVRGHRDEETGERYPRSIRAACDAAGISRSTYARWRQDDPEFRAALLDAMEDGSDLMEDEAHRRAMDGNDRMLELVLVGRRPEKYRPQPSTVVQQNNLTEPSVEQLARAMALMLAEAKQIGNANA